MMSAVSVWKLTNQQPFISFRPLILTFILDTHTDLSLATHNFESKADYYLHI